MTLSHRFRFLVEHPTFKKRPLRVIWRLAVWLLFKKLGFAPVIKIHRSSQMRLYPLKCGMGTAGLIYLVRGDFEEVISWCIQTYVKEGGKCLDIGANIGIWSLLMSEKCGSTGHVYSFEPSSATRKNLGENIALSKKMNITVIPTALGETKGEVSFFTPSDPGRASFAAETSHDAVQTVPVNRLDDVWEELGRPQISFVKMDVEGAEPLVLGGANLFFSECRPVVTSEINFGKLSNLGRKPEEICDFFLNHNYEMFAFDAGSVQLIRPDHLHGGDFVFIPKELK